MKLTYETLKKQQQEKRKAEEEAVKIFDLVKASHMLPVKIEELVPLSFIGNAAVNFYKTKIKMMNNLKVTDEQRKATLADGQDVGDMLLDIEARIGELLPSKEEMKELVKRNLKNQKGAPNKGDVKTFPEGINHKTAYQSRRIAENPDVVAKIKAEARKNEDIATKGAVLTHISRDKEEKRKDKATKEREKKRLFFPTEQRLYILKLMDILVELNKTYRKFPAEIPQNWSEEALVEARAFAKQISDRAKSIIKKMEVFKDGQTQKSISR